VAAVHVVAQEHEVGAGGVASNAKELEQVVKLAVNVPHNGHRRGHRVHVLETSAKAAAAAAGMKRGEVKHAHTNGLCEKGIFQREAGGAKRERAHESLRGATSAEPARKHLQLLALKLG